MDFQSGARLSTNEVLGRALDNANLYIFQVPFAIEMCPVDFDQHLRRPGFASDETDLRSQFVGCKSADPLFADWLPVEFRGCRAFLLLFDSVISAWLKPD